MSRSSANKGACLHGKRFHFTGKRVHRYENFSSTWLTLRRTSDKHVIKVSASRSLFLQQAAQITIPLCTSFDFLTNWLFFVCVKARRCIRKQRREKLLFPFRYTGSFILYTTTTTTKLCKRNFFSVRNIRFCVFCEMQSNAADWRDSDTRPSILFSNVSTRLYRTDTVHSRRILNYALVMFVSRICLILIWLSIRSLSVL